MVLGADGGKSKNTTLCVRMSDSSKSRGIEKATM